MYSCPTRLSQGNANLCSQEGGGQSRRLGRIRFGLGGPRSECAMDFRDLSLRLPGDKVAGGKGD